MICGSGGSKTRLATAAGAEPAGQMSDKKLRSTFPKSKCTKHAKLGALREGAKLRCRKSARRCGAKHISRSKCANNTILGPLLKVEMSKKRTPLWCEAHFEVKMYKGHQARSTFGTWDVEKVHAVVARSAFPSQNVKNTTCSDHFLTFRCRFAWQAQGIVHLAKSEKNVGVLWHFQKWWQAWSIWRGSAKMHAAWQAQYKRHVNQSC